MSLRYKIPLRENNGYGDRHSEVLKKHVLISEVIFAIPIESMSLEKASELRKHFIPECEVMIVRSRNIIDAVDGTAFCQLAHYLEPSNMIMISCVSDQYASKASENIFKWIKHQNKENVGECFLLLARKGHTLILPLNNGS